MGRKLPFKKPKELIELEPKIERLLAKYKLDRLFSLEDIETMIYECPPNKEMEVFNPLLKHIKSAAAYEEVLLTLHNELWNVTPLKMLGGKSPLQMIKSKSRDANDLSNDWMRLSDLLLGIQGEFQKQVYAAIDRLPDQLKEKILEDIHVLFQRFFYSATDTRPNAPSPRDILEEEARRQNIKIPHGNQIALRLFQSPAKSGDPHRQIRMAMGLENWQTFPIVADLLSDSWSEDNIFMKDGLYKTLLRKMKKLSLFPPEAILKTFVGEILEYWWKENKPLQLVFSKEEWMALWQSIIQKASGDWYAIDDAFDFIIQKIEARGISLSSVEKNIKAPKGTFYKPKNSQELLQHKFFFDLGSQLASCLLTPLTTYLPILELHYLEPLDLEKEITEYIRLTRAEIRFSEWLAKPSAQIRLRPLGKRLYEKAFSTTGVYKKEAKLNLN